MTSLSPLDIAITAPFHVGDVVARVAMESGESARVVLRDGRYQGDVPGKPVRVALTTEPAHLASLMSYLVFAAPGFRLRFEKNPA